MVAGPNKGRAGRRLFVPLALIPFPHGGRREDTRGGSKHRGSAAVEGGTSIQVLEAFLPTGVRVAKTRSKVVAVGLGILDKGHDSVLHLLHRRAPVLRRNPAEPSRHPMHVWCRIVLGCWVSQGHLRVRVPILVRLGQQQRGGLSGMAVQPGKMSSMARGVAGHPP